MTEISERELQVVRSYAGGRIVVEVADHLGIAVPTVKNHLKAARAKRGARHTAQLIYMLVSDGTLEPRRENR